MPYIPIERRRELDAERDSNPYATGDRPKTAGELNYVLTETIIGYLEDGLETGYREINEVVGVLECCKLELYRRVAVPYEDRKIVENGDVYRG